MGKALEILSGGTVAPTAGLALVMAAGDSLTIRDYKNGGAYLLQSWGTNQAAVGFFQIRSPRMHDNVRGIQFPLPIIPLEMNWKAASKQLLDSQDQLTCFIAGSAVGGDLVNASMLVYYDDLPGIDVNFLSPEELQAKGVDCMSCQNTIVAATGPNYTGAQALNTTNDLMKANTQYALIGYTVDNLCNAVTWRGSDTGNLRFGGPGRILTSLETNNYFVDLSKRNNLPLIPVFNSANKANTFVEAHQDENAGAVILTSYFVELAK